MHTKTVLTTFAIITALGIILTATSLLTQPSPPGFGITLCSSPGTVGGNACIEQI